MSHAIKKLLINSVSDAAQLEDFISGWYTALKIRAELADCNIHITHLSHTLESNANRIGIVSLNIQQLLFLRTLGIDEKLLIRTCAAHHTLGKRYLAWSHPEQDFVLAEGDYGMQINNAQFQHFVTQLPQANFAYDKYSIAAQMARQDKFVHPVADKASILSTYTYGMNVDAFKFAEMLMKRAISLGIQSECGDIEQVWRQEDTIQAISIRSANIEEAKLEADFYFNCASGHSAFNKQRDAHQPIKASSEAQTHLVAPLLSGEYRPLVNQIQSHDFGWSRICALSTGAVIECFYHAQTKRDEVIKQLALQNIVIDEEQLTEKPVTQSIIQNSWIGNCVLLGKASCDLDPILHNYLDVVDEQLTHFLKVFPSTQYQHHLVDFYNRNVTEQSLSLLDIVNAHYFLSDWRNSDFWQAHKSKLGSKLSHILALFKQTGIFPEYENQYVVESIWINFLVGFNYLPEHAHPLSFGEENIASKVASFEGYISQFLSQLPKYDDYLKTSTKP